MLIVEKPTRMKFYFALPMWQKQAGVFRLRNLVVPEIKGNTDLMRQVLKEKQNTF